MNRAVFLDRDGTILERVDYMTDPARVKLAPGAADALRRLRAAGYLLVIVSNQSLIARRLGTLAQARAVSRRMEELFASEGVQFDAIKYCFDPPESNSLRRKPNPGMILETAVELNIDLRQSAMIGDDLRDPQAGRAAGCAINLLISLTPVANEVTTATFSDAVAHILKTN